MDTPEGEAEAGEDTAAGDEVGEVNGIAVKAGDHEEGDADVGEGREANLQTITTTAQTTMQTTTAAANRTATPEENKDYHWQHQQSTQTNLT